MKRAVVGTTIAFMIIFAVAGYQAFAQSNANAVTRVITLGTLAGPVPMPHRARRFICLRLDQAALTQINS